MLKSLFSKNHKFSTSPKARTKYGIFASIYGIITNLALCVATFSVGLISGSVALMSEAVNVLSDGISSGVTLLGFKVSSKPADKRHPFGYARFEYVSALIISFIICIIGAVLCKSSFDKIIKPEEVIVSWAMLIVLAVSVVVKISQYLIYKRIGEAIDSETLNASKVDTRNDSIVTFLTLVAMIFMWVTGIDIDAYVGLAVSLFIVVSGFKVLLDAVSPLLGEKPDEELVKKIKRKLKSFDGVLAFHELIVHSYGKDTNFVSVHIEVSADDDPLAIHEMVDQIEEDFLKDLKIHLVVHTDPVDNKNAEVNKLKAKAQKVLNGINKKLVICDFHVSEKKKYTHIMFDCTVPYELGITKAKILRHLRDSFEGDGKLYKFRIDIDRDFS
ncbi:MAG: cation transporter [Clostridiales bacterium]|nr:cation transporter [Clostridiales bacterium]